MSTEWQPRLNAIFLKVLNIGPNTSLQTLEYQTLPNWDSIRHVELFIKISNEFKIQFTLEEVVSLKSYLTIAAVVKSRNQR